MQELAHPLADDLADDGVLGLCEQVCGSLDQQLETLALVVNATGSA